MIITTSRFFKTLRFLITGALIGGATGCGKLPIPDFRDAKFPGIYRPDIQQGNVILDEDFARLEIGMTKRKVGYLIGTAAVQDVFHRDRWDYVYTYQKDGGEREQRIISVFFSEGKLARIVGDIKPPDLLSPKQPRERVLEVPTQASGPSIIEALNPWSEEAKRVRERESLRARRKALKEEVAKGGAAKNNDKSLIAGRRSSTASPRRASHRETAVNTRAKASPITATPAGGQRSASQADADSLYERLSKLFSAESPRQGGRTPANEDSHGR